MLYSRRQLVPKFAVTISNWIRCLGLSSEQSFSPTRTTDVDDFQSADCEFLEDAKSVISTAQSVTDLKDETLSETESTTVYVDETSFDAVEFVKEEVVEYEEIPISSVSDSSMWLPSNILTFSCECHDSCCLIF